MLEFPVLHQEKQITVISALDSLGKERQAEEEDTLISKTHIHISSQLCHATEREPELKSSRGLHTSHLLIILLKPSTGTSSYPRSYPRGVLL